MKRDNEKQADELFEQDGARPQETVGPQDCEGSLIRMENKPGEGAGGVEDSEWPATEELHESFPIEDIPVIMGPDGLPLVVTLDPEHAESIPFVHETTLCIEDNREYVELWDDEVAERGWQQSDVLSRLRHWYWDKSSWLPKKADKDFAPTMVRGRFNAYGGERKRLTFKPKEISEKFGVCFAQVDWPEKRSIRLVPVRPRRERCKYYARQVFSNDSIPDPTEFGHQLVFRVCTKRRSNGGAFMSLRDEGIYVCDLRNPPDKSSQEYQDAKDNKKLQNRPHELRIPMFGIQGEDIKVKS